MPLFSTIAQPANTEAKRFPLKGMAASALALIVGVGIGAAIANDRPADQPTGMTTAVNTGLAHDEFLRLNTTDLEYPSETVLASNAVRPAAFDPFLYWNTIALDGLVPARSSGDDPNRVSEQFLEWNISSMQFPVPSYSERPSGPR